MINFNKKKYLNSEVKKIEQLKWTITSTGNFKLKKSRKYIKIYLKYPSSTGIRKTQIDTTMKVEMQEAFYLMLVKLRELRSS